MRTWSVRSVRSSTLPLLCAISVGAAFAACSTGDDSGGTPLTDGGTDASVEGGSDTANETGFLVDTGPLDTAPVTYSDFPSAPVLDGGVTKAPDFGAPGASNGPCFSEPELGSVYPKNWLRPRFSWSTPGGENVFELRLHVANQTTDLVVVTDKTTWTMPLAMWTALATHSTDVDIELSIRGGKSGAGGVTAVTAKTSGPLRIAPVDAPGSIVYWTTTTKSLKGFKIGDESVVEVLAPSQVKGRTVDCVGCHASSPDGDFIGTSTKLESPSTDRATEYADFVTPIKVGEAGSEPPWLGAGAKTVLLNALRGAPTFSKAHWATGDRLIVTALNGGNPTSSGDLTWIDLEAATAAAATGKLARTGDTGAPVFPTWSHDGKTVTYVSCKQLVDARADLGPGDLYSIPFAGKAGGAATKVPGASTAEFEENYPAYAPDDAYLAFARVPAGGNMLFNESKEVMVIPAAGGTAKRLEANDPPACSGKKSPGVSNSFPKWAPVAQTDTKGDRWYWLVFSSKRDGTGRSKLYLTPYVVHKDGSSTGYAAIYLWNQPDEDNHTPAWDLFKTPPVK